MRIHQRRIRCALAGFVCLSILPTVCTAQERAEGAASNPGSTALLSQNGERYTLSTDALEVAKIIDVEPLIARLLALRSPKDGNGEAGTTLEELLLRQQITDSILRASLDVDSVVSKIDYEREQTVELRTLLLSQQERAIGSTNTAILAIGTGLGVISSALSISESTSTAKDVVGFTAGGLSTLLWFRSYRQQRGGRRPAWVLPNMLGPFFSDSEGPHIDYPAVIWTYLNSAPPGGIPHHSRKEQLLSEWMAAGRIGPVDSAKSKQKIALLTTTNGADKNLHLDSLSERAAMLADVRDRVSLMSHDLRDLMQGLRPR